MMAEGQEAGKEDAAPAAGKIPKAKTPMSHEDRLKLAAKLDKELDEFIESRPKTKYRDGWPEDRWEEEMAKHPFFMKSPPEPGADLHPLYEGLQKLKYDPEENEPEELAAAYKDDGNFNFKHKNYRVAVLAYTEGIQIVLKAAVRWAERDHILATLYNNRSAAHWYLQNYRSGLIDCEHALKLNPHYDDKVRLRAANCCYALAHYERARTYCESVKVECKAADQLRDKCVKAMQIKERDERRRRNAQKKCDQNEMKVIEAIRARGIRIDGGTIDLGVLEPQCPQLAKHTVHFGDTVNLIWPVIFVYPQYQILDYIQEFCETDLFVGHLETIFATYPEWDQQRQYRSDNVNVYVERENGGSKLMKIDVNRSLGDLLTIPGYVVKGGTPSFIVFVKDSPAEQKYLRDC